MAPTTARPLRRCAAPPPAHPAPTTKGRGTRGGRRARAARGGRRRCGRRRVRLRGGLRPERAQARADRAELVRVRGRRVVARRDPGREEQAGRSALAGRSVGAEGDGRDRGQTLLRARRHRSRGHRPRAVGERRGRRGRAGRVDDHAAARAQPLHLAGADGAAQGQGGVPRDEAPRRVVEGADPRHVPQPGVLREPRVRHRGGGADVLLEVGARADAARGGSSRRADAGTVGVRPVRRARQRRWRGAIRFSTRCSTRG